MGEITQCRTGDDGVLWWRLNVQTRLMRIDDENDFKRLGTVSHTINSTYRDDFVLDKTYTISHRNLLNVFVQGLWCSMPCGLTITNKMNLSKLVNEKMYLQTSQCFPVQPDLQLHL